MDASGSHASNRSYYDAFSERYEAQRGPNDPGGYHDLVDELEAEFVRRYGNGADVLEVGCGTGLLLERIQRFARSVKGVDLSPGMLAKARERGHDVLEASATDLPFADQSFDVTCSFKVLAHVKEIERALSEMARVTRVGGYVIAEFYNPYSMRALLKRLAPPGKVADGTHERHVYTRFDSPRAIARLVPSNCRWVASRGVRIATPTAHVMRHRVGNAVFRKLERLLCDSPLRALGGFYVVALERVR
ncbi:MAG TPA: class I SAM-dependent methyltransferase [Polyangiaceae bacterium]|nr:class I SAM-dependent methyltransferase [Polyangiaceae bacterium]